MDRDEKGRFALGHPGGPGRPRRQTEREYLDFMLGGCSLEDWREIVQKAVADAKRGDGVARNWLARYLLDEPQAPTPTTRAVEEFLGDDFIVKVVADKQKWRKLGFDD